MAKTRVEFRTYDGIILRGDYFPAGVENAPVVIMTQGLTLLKECYIDDIARRFQHEGIAALVYDHRGWGSSEGNPYHETNPSQQAEDYHDAVSYVRSLAPKVDPSRVAIWGIGHSGGASIIATADDPRIKAAIFHMPFTYGRLDAKSMPTGYLEEACRERETHATTANHKRSYIPVWDDTVEQARSSEGKDRNGRIPWLHGEGLYGFITGGVDRSRKAGTPWENSLTLQSLYHISRVEPEDWIAKIEEPRSFLYIAAATDVLTGELSNHKRVFERSKNPNARFVQTGESHADNYFGNWESCVQEQVQYLKEFL
ncbi:hypothetical protein H2200_005669 [Cladophialophora chaetospira]|uniref:Serine aminopeptidase S33 domain-containing protein n=1 Tax=Cladophialophora chaetospira TaxID=386627 RepID=A0AA39CIL2_9EURO|nr:hypothetical protein H2200_005669 [Cladophialophora chaetospira]